MRKVGDRVKVEGVTYKAVPEWLPGLCSGCDLLVPTRSCPMGDRCTLADKTIWRRVETETEKPMNETEAKPEVTPAPAWELRIQTPCSVQELAEMLRAFAVPRTVTVEGSVIVVRP